MKVYKIYKYTNNITGKVYIGQTRQTIENRAQGKGWGYKKCPHFFNAIQKYGWDNFSYEILHDNLDKDDADILEREYIKRYKEQSYNIDPGGKSKGPHNNSDTIKSKISASMKGKNKGQKNGMYGRPSSKRIKVYVFNEYFELINEIDCISNCSKILNIESSRLCNYLAKNDLLQVQNLYYSKSKNIINCGCIRIKKYKYKPVGVSQYDENGNLVKYYKFTKDVCKDGLVNDNLLRSHRDKPWKYKNYIWVFDDIKDKYDILDVDNIKTFKPKKSESILNYTILYKYDFFGNFVKKYNYLAEAIREEHITYNSLKRIHYGPWISNGYIWTGENNLTGFKLVVKACEQLKKYTGKIPILQFDKNRNYISLYESMSQLKKKYGLISRDTFLKYISNGPFEYKNYIWTDLDRLNKLIDI